MKTDRELLDLSAKAAGVCMHPEDKLHRSYGNWGCDTTCMVCKNDPSYATFRPLTDDGDALRLMVRLGMNVEVNLDDECTRILDEFSRVMLRQMHVDGDAGAATRRAIVRAAAAIGENME